MYINDIKDYRRNLVKKLFEQEKTYTEIAYLTDYSESWIRQLHKVYKEDTRLLTELSKPGGSKCRLSAEDLKKLRAVLDKGSQSYGLEGSFWDRKRVKYVIEQEFKVTYNVEHISEILSKINYTLQKPEKKDFRQKAEAAQKWVEETLPEIKKSSARF